MLSSPDTATYFVVRVVKIFADRATFRKAVSRRRDGEERAIISHASTTIYLSKFTFSNKNIQANAEHKMFFFTNEYSKTTVCFFFTLQAIKFKCQHLYSSVS